jgi:hypothetical protein
VWGQGCVVVDGCKSDADRPGQGLPCNFSGKDRWQGFPCPPRESVSRSSNAFLFFQITQLPSTIGRLVTRARATHLDEVDGSFPHAWFKCPVMPPSLPPPFLAALAHPNLKKSCATNRHY